jgi:hypothetical protein
MAQDDTLSHLAEVRSRLAEGRSYIAAQMCGIEELKLVGQDTTKAEAILGTLLEIQELQEQEHQAVAQASRNPKGE